MDSKEAEIKEVKTISYQLGQSKQGMKLGETEGVVKIKRQF